MAASQWPIGIKNSLGLIDLENLAREFEGEKKRLFKDPDEDFGFSDMDVQGLQVSRGKGNINLTSGWETFDEHLSLIDCVCSRRPSEVVRYSTA